jgi:hypothetical protein
MLHPDTAYEVFRSFQAERQVAAAISRQLQQQMVAGPTLRDRLLLHSGEFMIALGSSLKAQAHLPHGCEAAA